MFCCFVSQTKPECCVSGDAELKRFDDIDYDSFVSLMGRRSAAQTNSELASFFAGNTSSCSTFTDTGTHLTPNSFCRSQKRPDVKKK